MARASRYGHQGDVSGESRASDYAVSKRIARENEASQRERIEGQMRAQGINPKSGRPYNAPAPPAPLSGRLHGQLKSGGGGTFAGAALGALAFFTLRAYVEGRWSGVKAFYAAKFLNKTSSVPNPVPITATPSQASPGAAVAPGGTPGSGLGSPGSSGKVAPTTTLIPSPGVTVIAA